MSLAFDKSAVVKEYKEEIEILQKDKDQLANKVGNFIIEKYFLVKKLVSLASSKERKTLLDIATRQQTLKYERKLLKELKKRN